MIQITPEERALLDTIASTEAPDYNVMYGGSRFDGYTDHPRQYHEITSGPNAGQKSSAAGRYQFLASTWDNVADRYGFSDFRPANQDMGAVALARENYARMTGRNLTADLASGDPETLANVGAVLSKTWTSLPSGIEEGQDADQFVAAFNSALGNPGAGTNQSISSAMDQASRTAGQDLAEQLADTRTATKEDPGRRANMSTNIEQHLVEITPTLFQSKAG